MQKNIFFIIGCWLLSENLAFARKLGLIARLRQAEQAGYTSSIQTVYLPDSSHPSNVTGPSVH